MEFKIGDKVWYRKRIGFRFSRVVSGTIDKISGQRATIIGTTKKGEPFSYTTSLDKLNLKKETIMKITTKQLDKLIESRIKKILSEGSEYKVISGDMAHRIIEVEKFINKYNTILQNLKKTKQYFDAIATKLDKSVTFKNYKVEDNSIQFDVFVSNLADYDPTAKKFSSLKWEVETNKQNKQMTVIINLLG